MREFNYTFIYRFDAFFIYSNNLIILIFFCYILVGGDYHDLRIYSRINKTSKHW